VSTVLDLPACLDIEASGFGRASYPIEIGFVLPDGQAWCTLIRPQADWTHWDDSAQALHGISRDTAVRHGRPAEEVADELNRRLHGRTLYCDGWAHDYSWLNRLFDAAERSPSFRLEHLLRLLNEDEAVAWQGSLRRTCAEHADPRHRASHDARMIQLTWQRLREKLVEPTGGERSS
jgi:hypothetical protein